MPPEAIRVADAPRHMSATGAIAAAGKGFTVTVAVVDAEQVLASVAVIVYIVVAVGDTLADVPLPAALH